MNLSLLPSPLADVHDLMGIAVGSKLSVPGRIGERKLSTSPVVIAQGSLSELPDIENAGGRLEAHDAFWPLTPNSIGLDDLHVEVGLVNLGIIGFVPLSLFFGVLGWATGATVGSLPVTVLAPGIPEGWVVRYRNGSHVPGTWAI